RGRSRRPLLHITSHSTAVPVLLRPSRVPPTVTVMGLRPEDLERGAVYRRHWLLENGMHPRHLSSPGMTRVLPTCYTRSEHPADLRRVVLAAQELLGVPSAACGATAAELFGMRLPRRTTRAGGAAIHLEVERGSAPRRTALLVVHRRAAHRPAADRRPTHSPGARRRRRLAGRGPLRDCAADPAPRGAAAGGARTRPWGSSSPRSRGASPGAGVVATGDPYAPHAEGP